MKLIAISVCCLASAEICTDPPPQLRNASLDAVVERALSSLAAPSISWQSFMRGINIVRCRPRAPSMCTDFFAARPAAFNHSAWGRSRKKNGRINNVPAQRPGVRFDLPRRSMASGSLVDERRSSPRTTYSGAPSTAGARRSGTSSGPTGRGAAAAVASAGGASITTTRCVDGRGSVLRRRSFVLV